jgi:hypothetical protein
MGIIVEEIFQFILSTQHAGTYHHNISLRFLGIPYVIITLQEGPLFYMNHVLYNLNI